MPARLREFSWRRVLIGVIIGLQLLMCVFFVPGYFLHIDRDIYRSTGRTKAEGELVFWLAAVGSIFTFAFSGASILWRITRSNRPNKTESLKMK